MTSNRRQRYQLCRWIGKITVLISIIFVTYLISKNYIQLMLIQGDSMKPTYNNMQLVFLDKTSDEYVVNDVIAFKCKELSTVLVKRIVAVPGDTVQIIDNALYVNGQKNVYYEDVYFTYAGITEKVTELTESQYFVIGDNVEKSKDSRYAEVGCVDERSIIGRVYR